jgi:hypothetical protein
MGVLRHERRLAGQFFSILWSRKTGWHCPRELHHIQHRYCQPEYYLCVFGGGYESG